ncbi:flagellar biosynthetic protein FliR [Paenibacillus crassostreae]|uniref:Flagellar biosynthetic protein FliR n=1 Tax=Paenibacillus crassostreae TaxID=1763538 RepID=A0A167FN38_9BACL|nr:flagellar biosynthetic protein FliR [Paenibacillus crassostreae]AOZ94235.1 flagellar biosynthetic protein FliR [Paenibacillus crassostreae]OAB76729.1 flagellar biosynthetic protein FliR [Paenibacillus crassostreae]
MELILQGFPIFLLIFCRITSFFVVAPIFSSNGVPNTLKIGLSFFISLLIYLTYGVNQTITEDMTYVLLIISEVMVGLLLGFVGYLLITVVQIAGSFIDIQIGFGMANVLDPLTGASVPLIGNFKYMIAMLLFLSMDGHLQLIDAIFHSYEWVPISNDYFMKLYNGSISEFLVRTFSQSFVLAFQMSAPLVVALFLTDVGLGFLAKTAPQFNIFVIGIPVKIFLGLAMLVLIVPSFSYVFSNLFTILFESLHNLLGVVGNDPN